MTSRRKGREATVKGFTSATLPATTVVTNIPAPVEVSGGAEWGQNVGLLISSTRWRTHQKGHRQRVRQCEGVKKLQWRWRCLERRCQRPEMSHPQQKQQLRKKKTFQYKKNRCRKVLDLTPKIRHSGGAAVHYAHIKDTATLCVRCRQVEMAERFGQKLQEEKLNSDYQKCCVKRVFFQDRMQL